jgi:DUF971 family protein
MEPHFPVEIHHLRERGIVRVMWEDDHVGEYPLAYLRGFCPCALCQGHGGVVRRFVEVADPKLSRIQAVGNYAIEFAWEDGHDTGIYTYDYLRSLCPCAECESRREGESKE